jgi:hypothetical protein
MSYTDTSHRLIWLDALQQSLRALKSQATHCDMPHWSPNHSINRSLDQCSPNADSLRPPRINAIPFTSPVSVWSDLSDAKWAAHCRFPARASLVAMPQAAESMQIEAAASELQRFVPTSHLTLASHFTVEAINHFRLFREALELAWVALLCTTSAWRCTCSRTMCTTIQIAPKRA